MVAIPSRREIIEQTKNAGYKVAAVLPIFYPRELLRAYGFQPIEVWGPPNISPHQQDHFQTYTCPIVRNATSFLLNGGLSETDLIFIPHTCDSLQGMGSVVKDFIKPDQAVLTLYHPRSHRTSDTSLLIEELKRIENTLQNLTGKKVPEDELIEAIQREEKADKSLTLLYQERNSIDLTDREFYKSSPRNQHTQGS